MPPYPDTMASAASPSRKLFTSPKGSTGKWFKGQTVLFEIACKKLPPDMDRSITLNRYIDIWLYFIAPDKLATSTLHWEKQDIARIPPPLSHYKLIDLRPEHFKKFYVDSAKRKTVKQENRSPKRR